VAQVSFMKTTYRLIPGIVLAATAALALSFAPAVSAQTAPEKKTTTSKKTTAPAAATDPAPAPRPTETRYPFNISLVLGPEFGDVTAFKFRIDGAMTLQPISREVGLDLVLPLGFSFWGQSYGVPGFGNYDVSYFRFELVPSARFTFPVAREITLYADAGLGFGFESVSVSSPFPVAGADSSGAFGVFRLAGGGFYNLSQQWRLVFEPVGLNFYFGTGSGFAYSLLFGANYRF